MTQSQPAKSERGAAMGLIERARFAVARRLQSEYDRGVQKNLRIAGEWREVELDACREELRGAVEALREADVALVNAHLPGEGMAVIRARAIVGAAVDRFGGSSG